MEKRAAIYVRVSTDKQTIENQLRELRQIAQRRGWQVVDEYHDAGISGAKGREDRPGLDKMLQDAQRRRFDVVMAWAIDRLGRSLIDLLGTIQTLEACSVDLYLDQQSIDTTTPAGRLMFQITGAFAEFERSMIRQRVNAGLKRAVEAGQAAWQGQRIRPGPGKTESRGFTIAGQQGYVFSRRLLLCVASAAAPFSVSRARRLALSTAQTQSHKRR